ncbi:hypothetical protein E2C01_019509 [Portunus trituberculatus]|uniref:Uncharacterized protein n=1 Tax=Portunus trituberculatus TaxID=210409 RepID=A0A5B7E0M3_PORTR|nr:hypothetical protein [Portunus trituberculatus]
MSQGDNKPLRGTMLKRIVYCKQEVIKRGVISVATQDDPTEAPRTTLKTRYQTCERVSSIISVFASQTPLSEPGCRVLCMVRCVAAVKQRRRCRQRAERHRSREASMSHRKPDTHK